MPSAILANLVIGQNVVPELLQEACTAEGLATALVPVIGDTIERQRQLEAFSRLDTIMEIGSEAPRGPRGRYRARFAAAAGKSLGGAGSETLGCATQIHAKVGAPMSVRRSWTAAILLVTMIAGNGGIRPVEAQTWPTRPVKVIMATAPGSAPDVIARIVTDRLSQIWGQQVLIINRPGAGGLIALQALATAERDGHTLYLPSSSSLVVLPETNSKLPLDLERDLVPVGLVGEQPFLIIAGNSLGVSTLAEFIALAKSKPTEMTYAANFRGSLPNMTGEWFRNRAGIDMTFVPYPGARKACKT